VAVPFDFTALCSGVVHKRGAVVFGGDSSFLADTVELASAVYRPVGNVTATNSPRFNRYQYQFTGRENDGTGLYFYRARYYQPGFQRFISQDPIGFGGGDANLYGLTLNSPVNWRDPLGWAIGGYPAPPPGYDPGTWPTGQWDPSDGWWNVTDPNTGVIYTCHPENKSHWAHWDKQGPGGDDLGDWPPNSKKPWPGQKRPPLGVNLSRIKIRLVSRDGARR